MLYALLTVLFVLVLLCLVLTARQAKQIARPQASVDRFGVLPPTFGGRAIPSALELAQARNRIDPQGLAHPGGS